MTVGVRVRPLLEHETAAGHLQVLLQYCSTPYYTVLQTVMVSSPVVLAVECEMEGNPV